jgi:hypothetical protein
MPRIRANAPAVLILVLFIAALAGCAGKQSVSTGRNPSDTIFHPIEGGASSVCIDGILYNSTFGKGEFQTTGAIDPASWDTSTTNNSGDTFTNDGLQLFNPATEFAAYPTVAVTDDPVTGDKSVLALSAFPVPSPIASDPKLLKPNGTYFKYLGAKIQSERWPPSWQMPWTYFKGFEQRYGFWVARMRMPKGPGIWSAFWLLSSYYDNGGPRNEWDINEMVDQNVYTNQQIWLWGNNPGYYGRNGRTGYYRSAIPFYQSFDPSQAYHDYGVLLSGSGATWFVDGLKTATARNYTRPFGEYMIFSLAVADPGNYSWIGDPANNTVWPQTMYIQYVRAYAPSSASC